MEIVKNNKNKGQSVRELFSEFEKIEFLMDELINELVRQTKNLPLDIAHKPLTLGFSIKINNQGQPIVEEHGNMEQVSTEKQVSYNSLEPMADVMDGQEDVIITVEIPGMNEQDIQVKFFGESGIVIEAKNSDIAYFKEINLSAQILKESVQKKYTNNILEVLIHKKTNK